MKKLIAIILFLIVLYLLFTYKRETPAAAPERTLRDEVLDNLQNSTGQIVLSNGANLGNTVVTVANSSYVPVTTSMGPALQTNSISVNY